MLISPAQIYTKYVTGVISIPNYENSWRKKKGKKIKEMGGFGSGTS
jgi:hypothetical protein